MRATSSGCGKRSGSPFSPSPLIAAAPASFEASPADALEPTGDAWSLVFDAAIERWAELAEANLPVADSEITYIPSTETAVDSIDEARKLLNLVDKLDELDDVQQVYCNAEISEAISEGLQE